LALGGCSQSDNAALPKLKGQYRVIAAFTDSTQRAGAFVNAFKSAPDLAHRDIVWFVVGPDRITSSSDFTPDRKRLESLHTVDGFQAVLIDKNGQLRASQLGGLNIQGLLDAIDQLPKQWQKD
jgi:hypothetical protein